MAKTLAFVENDLIFNDRQRLICWREYGLMESVAAL